MLRRKLTGRRAVQGVHARWFQGVNLILAPEYDENAPFEVMSCSSPECQQDVKLT